MAFIFSACGAIPSSENIEAFKSGARGKVSFDLSRLEGTRFYWIFKGMDSKIDALIHGDCFKERLLNLSDPIEILQTGTGLPVDFIKDEIHSINDVQKYIFSQTVNPAIMVNYLGPDTGAQADFNSITFNEDYLVNGERYNIKNAIHEIMHVIGFGHTDDSKSDFRFASIPYRAGRAAFICATEVL